MSPRSEEQNKEIREKRMRDILSTAMGLFARKGYHNTSISKIAKEAGISKGLMYNYFDSKEALLGEIIQQGVDEVWRHFDPDHDGTLTRDELHFFIEKTFQSVREHREFWHCYMSIMLQKDVRELAREGMKQMSEDIAKTFRDYFVRNGYEDPDTEMMLFATITRGIIFQYLISDGLMPMEKLEERIYKLYKL
jgi:AcrR family transcriptional regulator